MENSVFLMENPIKSALKGVFRKRLGAWLVVRSRHQPKPKGAMACKGVCARPQKAGAIPALDFSSSKHNSVEQAGFCCQRYCSQHQSKS